MKAKNRKIGWIICTAVTALVLSACGMGTPAEPTMDPNMVFTQVAETVMVSMTQTAESMPPTPTPEPTTTPEPTVTPMPTVDALATQPATQPAGFATATVQYLGDKAAWRSNNPADNSSFNPRQGFPLTVCFDNVGNTEWNDEYYLEYASGTNLFPTQNRWYIDAGIKRKPGERWCFTIQVITPDNPGSYISRYYMKNPGGLFMEEFYYPFKVVQ